MARWQAFDIGLATDDSFQITLDVVPSGGIATWTMEFIAKPFATVNSVLMTGDWSQLGTAVITKTTNSGGGITILDPTAGIIQVQVAAGDTASLPPGWYVYTLKRIDSNNNYQIAYGDLFIQPQTA